VRIPGCALSSQIASFDKISPGIQNSGNRTIEAHPKINPQIALRFADFSPLCFLDLFFKFFVFISELPKRLPVVSLEYNVVPDFRFFALNC
jgi:hypothetical protein